MFTVLSLSSLADKVGSIYKEEWKIAAMKAVGDMFEMVL